MARAEKQKEMFEKVLNALKEFSSPPFIKELAKKVGVTPQTLSKYLLALKGLGKVEEDTTSPPYSRWKLKPRR